MEIWTVKALINGREIGMGMEEQGNTNSPQNGALFVPPYQRSEAWQSHQMRMLIDSVMRGYGLPPIYLRQDGAAYKIVDGQQRLNALCYFASGFIKSTVINQGHLVIHQVRFPRLYNPANDGTKMKLPRSLQIESAWGGLFFSEFAESLEEQFLHTPIFVNIMECEYDTECDFFIRLQGGKPLNPQEVRDAWRGNFCNLILEIGGKPKLNRLGETTYDGNRFFPQIALFNPANNSDRGATRQLAAQMLMLFLDRKQYSPDSFTSINTQAIDNAYGEGAASMETETDEVKRFVSVLEEVGDIFIAQGMDLGGRTYEPIHMVLLADMLLDGFSSQWKENIASAFGQFMEVVDGVQQIPTSDDLEDENYKDIWHYYRMTKTQVHQAETVKKRHALFVRQMLRFLGDSARAKLGTEGFMEAVYCRNKKVCKICGNPVEWPDADFQRCENHDTEMSCPNLRNHALVHGACNQQ